MGTVLAVHRAEGAGCTATRALGPAGGARRGGSMCQERTAAAAAGCCPEPKTSHPSSLTASQPPPSPVHAQRRMHADHITDYSAEHSSEVSRSSLQPLRGRRGSSVQVQVHAT